MLADAPTFPEVWPTIKAILRHYRRVMVYNADFDARLLGQTARRYGYAVPRCDWSCLMEQYAVYHGDWHPYYKSFIWQKLSVACALLGVQETTTAHRATADALGALGVLRALAAHQPESEEEAW